MFSDILGSVGHFFVIFWGRLVTFFEIFGVLGALWTCSVSWGRLGAQNKVAIACPWSPLGSISAPFFEQNRVSFHVGF